MKCEICQEEVANIVEHIQTKHPNRPDYLAKVTEPAKPAAKPGKTWPPK